MSKASTTYVLEEGSTFKSVAITSGQEVRWDLSSSVSPIVADGSRHVLKQVTDQIQTNIQVTSLDASYTSNANFYPGASGALVLKVKLRGDGSTTSTVATVTFSEVVFVGASAIGPNDGTGAYVMNFVAYNSDDSGSIVSWA